MDLADCSQHSSREMTSRSSTLNGSRRLIYRPVYRRHHDDLIQVSLRPFDPALANKTLWRVAFQLHLTHAIDFADAYNAACMQRTGVFEIYSDEDFDQIPGLTRVEPGGEEAAA